MKEIQLAGERIKELRENKQMSREELAQATVISVEQIICIEENIIQPPVATLLKIARELGVRMATFIDEEVGSEVLCNEGEAHEPVMNLSTEEEITRKQLDYYALCENKVGKHMHPYIVYVEKEQDNQRPLSSHQGEEFIHVLGGEVIMVCGDETCEMKQGDNLYFSSTLPHKIYSKLDTPAKILAVLYTPE